MTLSQLPKLIFSGLFFFTLVSLVPALSGCRSSRPTGNLFQVTQHGQGDASDVDAPRQRLASTKQRAGSILGKAAEEESTAENTKWTKQATNQRMTRQVSYDEESEEKLSDQPISDGELLAAFEGTSPEIKDQALRQLVAVLSRSAETTEQPAPLTAAIKDSLHKQHDLPKAKNQPAREPLKRLAMQPESSGRASGRNSWNDDADSSDDVFAVSDQKTEDSSELQVGVVESLSDREPQSNSVRTASATEPKNGELMVATAATQSPIDPDALSDNMLYASLLKRISTPVEGESEADRARRMITARHLMVLAGNPDAAVGKIDGMTDKEQEYLRHQLLGLWTMVDPDGHPVQSRRFSSALPQLREATRYLAAATDSLEVRSLAFCTEILAYGQIKKFDSSVFKPAQQVILYCEVDNFVASKVDSGYQTSLQGSYDILDSENQKVASQLLPADQQVSSNYLRDYFIAYQMHLPQKLDAGRYRLQLTMEDIEGKKYGQSSIGFEIQ